MVSADEIKRLKTEIAKKRDDCDDYCAPRAPILPVAAPNDALHTRLSECTATPILLCGRIESLSCEPCVLWFDYAALEERAASQSISKLNIKTRRVLRGHFAKVRALCTQDNPQSTPNQPLTHP